MVKKKLDTQVKSQKEHAAELYEAARLQSAMAFGLDDKPILGVDAPSNSSGLRTASSSISSNPVARAATLKRKRKESGGPAIPSDAMLLANSF